MNRPTLNILCVASFALVAACSGGGTSGTLPVAGQAHGGNTGAAGTTGNGGSTGTHTGGSTGTETGGSTGTETGGVTETGGSTETGGVTENGGSSETGGVTTASSTGGATSSGGVTENGGSTTASSTGKTGGTTSSGGVATSATTKTGGTSGSGGVTTASSTAKTGGTTSAGGSTSSGGVTASGGTTTSTTGAGGVTALDPNSIVPTLNGYMWLGTCSDGPLTGLDCNLLPLTGGTACPNATSTDFTKQGTFRSVTHTVTGAAGKQYTLNFEVRGVLGGKCYSGGTMRTTTLSANPEASNDGWYMGGQPVPSKWNTYEIHVKPAVGTTNLNPLDNTENIYFLNAFPYPPAITYGQDTYCEAHETFPFKYSASFPVMGNSVITLTLHDSNCLAQMNCGGPNRQASCANSRTIDLTGMPAPANFTQPYKQSNGDYPQWVLFNVKTVTSP